MACPSGDRFRFNQLFSSGVDVGFGGRDTVRPSGDRFRFNQLFSSGVDMGFGSRDTVRPSGGTASVSTIHVRIVLGQCNRGNRSTRLTNSQIRKTKPPIVIIDKYNQQQQQSLPPLYQSNQQNEGIFCCSLSSCGDRR